MGAQEAASSGFSISQTDLRAFAPYFLAPCLEKYEYPWAKLLLLAMRFDIPAEQA